MAGLRQRSEFWLEADTVGWDGAVAVGGRVGSVAVVPGGGKDGIPVGGRGTAGGEVGLVAVWLRAIPVG